jgi:predicted enzyme related to lactoylglutathione lyase
VPGVGEFRSVVVDVNDLAEGEAFWTAVTGYEVQFRAIRGEYTRIGKKGTPSVLLQHVPERKSAAKNRVHIDFTVDDVARAVDHVVGAGGTIVKPPAFWPDTAEPILEWAIMADPFGNELCVIREVRPTL